MRALSAAVLFLLAAVLGAVSLPGVASAADPESWVSIRITSLSPSLPDRAGTVRVSGRVTNTSKVQLSNLQAIFWRSLDPIQTQEGLDQALASPANQPLGQRVSDSNFQNIPSETDRSLDPGESTTFQLSVPMSLLTLPPYDAVYLVGVHVRGRTEATGPDITLGRARVFLPLVETPPTSQLRVTSVVVLTSRPAQIADGVLVDDHLATEVADGGRLDVLLAAAHRPDASFAVDPATVAELETMAHGYQVRAPDGTLSTGPGSRDAAEWLDDLDELIDDGDGYRLLFGNPDAAALVHDNQANVLEAADAAGKRVERTAHLPLLIRPAGGLADAETMAALARLSPAAVLLNEGSTGSSSPLLAGPDGIPVVNVATSTAGGGPGPDPSDTAVHIRQRMLAQTWIEASTATEGATIGQVRLISTAAVAGSVDADPRVPWLSRQTLTRLLASAPTVWDGDYAYPRRAADRELEPAQVDGISRLNGDYRAMSGLLVNSAGATEEGQDAVARAASQSWRRQLTAWQAFVEPQHTELDRLLRTALVIVASPRVVTSASSGHFPVTVRNTILPDPADPARYAMHARLIFVSSNARRLTVKPLDIPEVRAGESFSGTAEVEAASNGTVRVYAQLVTVSDDRVGRPVSIDIDATQAGTVGWIIALSAGIVLLATTALRIKQVARERGKAAASGPLDDLPAAQVVPPPDAVTADPAARGDRAHPAHLPDD